MNSNRKDKQGALARALPGDSVLLVPGLTTNRGTKLSWTIVAIFVLVLGLAMCYNVLGL